MSVLSGFIEIYFLVQQQTLKRSENFSFHAFKKDTIGQRQITVLIIGESSNYFHWQINGYPRPTSPCLNGRENLIVFPNAIAGCYYTPLSVPQMITRAHPDNMDLRFKEKSVLSAIRDAGFKTIWLSNQSDREIVYSGITVLHAKTAAFRFSLQRIPPYLTRPNMRGGRYPSCTVKKKATGKTNLSFCIPWQTLGLFQKVSPAV